MITAPPPPPASASDRSTTPRLGLPRHSGRIAAGAALVVLVTRLVWLSRPDGLVFDEVFYANDALDLLDRGVEGGSPAHPPLGKWMLAVGIRLFGFTPFGWRIVPLLAGAAVAALTCLAAVRATGKLRSGVVAGAVVALDGIAVVTGRLALLDGLVALWTTLGLLALVHMVRAPLDRDAQRRGEWVLGLAMGCAAATKWSGLMLVPVALVTVVAANQYLPRQLRWRALARTAARVLVFPALIYVAAHAGFLTNYDETPAGVRSCASQGEEPGCGTGPAERISGLWDTHRRWFEYHRALDPQHPDVASAFSWIAQTEAVGLFDKTCTDAMAANTAASDGACSGGAGEVRVLALGNPLIWLLGSAAMIALGWRAAVARDMVALVVLGVGLAFWLPWAIAARDAYAFYGAPLVPVLGVALAIVAESVPPRLLRWWPVVALPVVAVSAALWPVWTGASLDPQHADTILLDRWK